MLRRSISALTYAILYLISLYGFAQNEDAYSVKERIARIHDLGKRGSEAIPALAQYLGDPNREIRAEAVKSIVKIGTEASLGPLIEAVHDKDAEIQIRATDGIVNFYVPGYVAQGRVTGRVTRGVRQMKSLLSSRDNQVVDPSVSVRSDVAAALGDEIRTGASTDARANSARAAGILRARPTVPALLDALRSKDSELIFESLVALQKIDDPSAGTGVSFLAHDLDDRIQATALETIGVLHSTGSAPDVRAVLRDARNTKIRRAALECLAMLGLPADRAVFQQYLNDSDTELRASALEGLGRIREPEDSPAIEQIYNEKGADPKVHLAAAFALVNEGNVDTSEFSPLSYLVENLNVKGQRSAARAYVTELCRRDDVCKALLPMLREASKDEKLALCSAFAESRNENATPALKTLSKDIDPDVSLAASKALKAMQASSEK